MDKLRRDSKGNILREREGERSDGVYYYRYRKDGKRYYIYSKTLSTLREKVIKMSPISSIPDLSGREAINKYGAIMTLNDLADIYMENKKSFVERTTYNTMICNYNYYVRNNIGGIKIVELRDYSIRNLYLFLYLGENDLSLNTLSRINGILSQMLKIAYEEEVITKNPTVNAIAEIKKMEKENTKETRALTRLEQKAFVDYCKKTTKHSNIKNLIFLLLGTGCRVGEALALTWDDIDFAKNVININHAVAYTKNDDGHYGYYIKRPKTKAGNRDIPMLKDVRDALIDEKEKQLNLKQEQFEFDGYHNFVFVSKRGGFYSRENISTQIKQIIDEYNAEENDIKLPDFSTNVLRHTFATRLCSRTADMKAVQYIMGHKDICTTLKYYAEPTDEGIRNSMSSLEGVMF